MLYQNISVGNINSIGSFQYFSTRRFSLLAYIAGNNSQFGSDQNCPFVTRGHGTDSQLFARFVKGINFGSKLLERDLAKILFLNDLSVKVFQEFSLLSLSRQVH
jgi:hypothetical protein